MVCYGKSSDFHAFINFILGFAWDATLAPLLFHNYGIYYDSVIHTQRVEWSIKHFTEAYFLMQITGN
jgi:hypothetical protein